MNFIVGRHGGADLRVIAECVNTYLARGFVLNVVPVDLFVPTMLGLCREVSCDRFEYRYADKVQRNDRQLCPPGFERAFRHLTRLQKMQTSGYNRVAGVGLPARDKSEFEGGRNNEYRENREEWYHLRSCSQ